MDGGRKRSHPDNHRESLYGPPLKRLRAGNGSGVPRDMFKVQDDGQGGNANEQHENASFQHAQHASPSSSSPTPTFQTTEYDADDEAKTNDSDDDVDSEYEPGMFQWSPAANWHSDVPPSALADDGGIDKSESDTSSDTGYIPSETADDISTFTTDASKSITGASEFDLNVGDDDLDSVYPLEIFEGSEQGPIMLATEQKIQEVQPEQEQHQSQQVQPEPEQELEQMPLQANEQHQFAQIYLQVNGQLSTPPSSP